jgi:hypothetical protein
MSQFCKDVQLDLEIHRIRSNRLVHFGFLFAIPFPWFPTSDSTEDFKHFFVCDTPPPLRESIGL